MKLCLDTSAYSNFKRGDERVVALLDAAGWIGLSVVALGELRTGFALGARREANERELARFLGNPVVHVLDVDDRAAQIYADIVASLRRARTPLPTNDIWIAAVAAREGAEVVSHDAHFRAIPRVGAHIFDR